jgi:hypothetical protein
MMGESLAFQQECRKRNCLVLRSLDASKNEEQKKTIRSVEHHGSAGTFGTSDKYRLI